jgi:DNA-binding HxlR family transcriptional regulator
MGRYLNRWRDYLSPERRGVADSEMVRALIEGMSGTWEPAVLLALENGPLRSAQLRRDVSLRVSYRVFHDTLQRLEDRHLIERHDQGPHDVSYELTNAGRHALGFLKSIEAWGRTHPEGAVHVYRHPPGEDR